MKPADTPVPILGRPTEYDRAHQIFNRGRHPTFIGRITVERNAVNGGLMFWQFGGKDCAVSIVNPRSGTSLALCVLPEYRRKGVASFIVRYLASNFRRVIESKVPFFESLGYQRIGHWKPGLANRTGILIRKDLLTLGGRLRKLKAYAGEEVGEPARVVRKKRKALAGGKQRKLDRANARHPSKRKGLARPNRK